MTLLESFLNLKTLAGGKASMFFKQIETESFQKEKNLPLRLPLFKVSGIGTRSGRQFCIKLAPFLEEMGLRVKILTEDGPSPVLLSQLGRFYDVVFVVGNTDCPLREIVVMPNQRKDREVLLEDDLQDLALKSFALEVMVELDRLLSQQQPNACILIGGKSRRMGTAKHLLPSTADPALTWLESTVATLSPHVNQVVLCGGGEIPKSLSQLIRLADVNEAQGPLAGLLAACRWQPFVPWLVVACDMPAISEKAIVWLLQSRSAKYWARVPRLAGAKHNEPLFALYEFRAGQLLEEQLLKGGLRIQEAMAHPKVWLPQIPEHLHSAWRNVNTPQQLVQFKDGGGL